MSKYRRTNFSTEHLCPSDPCPHSDCSPLGEMAPARAGFCPLLLLLLLGLWVAEIPVSAKSKDVTSSQWFKTQHVQPSPEACY